MGSGVAIMKLALRCSMLFLAIALLSACTISHEFGPYKGKVVDAATGEPLEGAVVFMKFNTENGFNPAGAISKYADAVEVLTDKNGEFEIGTHKVRRFRILHQWEPLGYVIIFKPDYGTYPRHEKSQHVTSPFYTLPENEYVTIKLPKLHTKEDRKTNLGRIFVTNAVPYEKQKNLFDLKNIESINLGLEPIDPKKIKEMGR